MSRQPPTFNKTQALALAARCVNAPSQKPREPGQRAILAVHYRRLGHFARDEDAWQHFESSRQRFYEWHPSVMAIDLAVQPTPQPPVSSPNAGWGSWSRPRPATARPIPPMRVAPSWMKREVPAIQSVEVGNVTLTPTGQRSKRTLSATVQSPGGSEYHREAEVLYSHPGSVESGLEATRRHDRQRHREESALRSLDFGGAAAEAHRAKRARHDAAAAFWRTLEEHNADAEYMADVWRNSSWRDPEVHLVRVFSEFAATQTPCYQEVSSWLQFASINGHQCTLHKFICFIF